MPEFLLQNVWSCWLIAAAVFLLLEAATVSMISIWFVPGAVLTSILSIWVDSFAIQLTVFLVLSVIFVFLCRRFFIKNRSEKLDDTNSKLIGKTAIAQTDVSETEGKVMLGDVYWRAVSSETIEHGERVVITAVSGNLLTVNKK